MLVVGRQHALINKCALNNELRLKIRVYGIIIILDICSVGMPKFLCMNNMFYEVL